MATRPRPTQGSYTRFSCRSGDGGMCSRWGHAWMLTVRGSGRYDAVAPITHLGAAMERTELLLDNIGVLLTMDSTVGEGRLGVVSDAAVAVSGDRIQWFGPRKDLPAEVVGAPGVEVVDVAGRVVTPGLVDCHTHLVFGGSREAEFARRVEGASYQEIAAEGGGILSTMRATRAAPFDELVESGAARLDAMLRFGVTTCEVKSGYGLSPEAELKMLRVIRELDARQPVDLVPTFLGAHSVPPEFRDDREGYLRLVIDEMIPAVVSEGLAEFCDVFCEKGVFDLEESRRVLEAARDAGLGVKVHAEQLTPFGGARLAAELGAVSADHLECIDEGAVAAMKNAGTVAVLLPGATFFLNQDFPHMNHLLDAGIPVAVSTDFNPGSSPGINLQLAGTMAAVRMRLPLEDVWMGITTHAARALRRQERLGMVKVGMAADLAVFDVTDYRTVFYRFGVNHCTMVVKNGKVVVS